MNVRSNVKSVYTHAHTLKAECHKPSFTMLSLKRLVRMAGSSVPVASRMPVSMASLACSDSVKAFRKRSSCPGQTKA